MSVLNAWMIVLLAGATLACSGPAEQTREGPEVEPPGAAAVVPVAAEPSRPLASLQRVTPILAVDAIEPVVPFWEALGFTATNPSYADGKLMFMAFGKDGLEIHYQTIARIEDNTSEVTDAVRGGKSLLYLTVSDLDATVERLGGAAIVIPRRQTSWGADEIYVREPAGHIIGFAQFGGN